MKDRGGLLYLSRDVLKILKICETVFIGSVSGDNFLEPKIKEKCNLKLKLRNRVLRSLPSGLFSDLECDFNNEDLPSTQLIKDIVDKYMNVRLLRYGQYYTEMKIIKGKCGMRQKLNKTVLFQNL